MPFCKYVKFYLSGFLLLRTPIFCTNKFIVFDESKTYFYQEAEKYTVYLRNPKSERNCSKILLKLHYTSIFKKIIREE